MTLRSRFSSSWNPTERDFTILRDIGEHGLLDTRMIHQRHWPEGTEIRSCQKRMAILKKEGLVCDAPLVVARQISSQSPNRSKKFGGSLPTAYGLTPKGAEVLLEETGEAAKRISRSDPAPVTLLHRLGVVAVRLAFDEGAKAAGLAAPQWILEQDTYSNARLDQPAEKRHLLYERFRSGENQDVSCRPDASVLLRHATGGDSSSPRFLVGYLEIDRSTNSPDRELAKSPGYDCLLRSGVVRQHWPCLHQSDADAVRVFYVCESVERIASLASVLRDQPVAAFYRFGIKQEVLSEGVLREPIWRDTQGRRYAILRRSG